MHIYNITGVLEGVEAGRVADADGPEAVRVADLG